MPLQKSSGNMYDWVTHVWNCIIGECPHKCVYCYVKKGRFMKDHPIYKGPQRFNPKDENINLGTGRTIFVAHTNDLFTADQYEVIKVLKKCIENSQNTYVFQTKDPLQAMKKYSCFLPSNCIFGTTIESDIHYCDLSNTVSPYCRFEGIKQAKREGFKTFITIEPIMRFTDIFQFGNKIIEARPDFVNIGADSKKCNLPEPTWDEVSKLIAWIRSRGVIVKEKSNLERLRRTQKLNSLRG